LQLSLEARLETVRVADALARDELLVLAAEGMAVPRAEVRERHPVGAPDLRLQVMDLAGEAVRGQPLGHGLGVEEGAVDFLGLGAEHAMELDGVGHGPLLEGSIAPSGVLGTPALRVPAAARSLDKCRAAAILGPCSAARGIGSPSRAPTGA